MDGIYHTDNTDRCTLILHQNLVFISTNCIWSWAVNVSYNQTELYWPIWKDADTGCQHLIDYSNCCLVKGGSSLTATNRPRWFHESSLADSEVGLPYIVRWLIDPVVCHCSWRLMQNFTNIHTWKMVHTVPSETSQEEHQKQTQPPMGLLWVQTCFCPAVIPRQVSLLANAAPTLWG